MRGIGAISCCVVLMLPAIANASTTRPPIDPSKCAAGNSTEMTEPESQLFTQSTNPNTAKTWIQNGVYCPNACYDLNVSLTLTYSGLQVEITGTNKCSSSTKAPNDPSQNPPRGCSAGLQQPQLTITTKDIYSTVIGFQVPDQTVQRSRCDESVIDSSLNNFFAGLNQVMSNPQSAQAQMQSALSQLQNAPATQAPYAPPALTSTVAAQAAQAALQNPQPPSLVQGLVALGATPQQAQSAVNGDTPTVQKLLNAVASGDTQTAITAASGLNLNPGLSNGILALNVGQSVGNSSGVVVGTAAPIGTSIGNYVGGGSTFTTSLGVTSGASNPIASLLSSVIALFSNIVSGIRTSFSGAPATAPPVQAVQPASATSTQGQPVATIIAQPSVVSVGNDVTISWSSVGLNSCVVSENGSPIANGLVGTESLVASSTGSLVFLLVCTSATGGAAQDTASVMVQ